MILQNQRHDLRECNSAEDVRSLAERARLRRQQFFKEPDRKTTVRPEEKPEPTVCQQDYLLSDLKLAGVVSGRLMGLPEQQRPYTIQGIKVAVAGITGVSVDAIDSIRRSLEVVAARHIAMMLAHHLTRHSYPTIGRQFGGRDHSSVIYAVQKMAKVLRDIKPNIYPGAPMREWVSAALESHHRVCPKPIYRKARPIYLGK
jgi:hypothetical protein